MSSPPVSERRAETRRLLIDAAEELIAERGVNGSTVVQICERAGFTRGAFYSNFSTKEELCLALLRRQLEHYLGALGTASTTLTAGGPDATRLDEDQRIAQALELFLAAADDDATGLLVRMEMRLHALRTPEFRRPLLRIEAELVRRIGAIVSAAAERLGLRLRVPPRQVVTRLYAAYEAQTSAAMMLGRALRSPETIRALSRTFAACVEPADQSPSGQA